jgi:large subunit ribosomal protein L6
MSRIGKKPIDIPEKTEVLIAPGLVNVKGPKGELNLAYKSELIDIRTEDGKVILTPKGESLEHNALWGTYASEISSMIKGVNSLFEKKLIIEGVGFKADVKEDSIVLNIGFSHPVKLKIPTEINCSIEKNEITVSGISKEKVGQFTAVIRSKKKPEPYKGKGIRYSDEVIRRKEGKKAV